LCRSDAPSGGQPFDRAALRDGDDPSDRPATVGDLDRFPAFDIAQVSAGVLAQLADPY
jgi:hypothetical protein